MPHEGDGRPTPEELEEAGRPSPAMAELLGRLDAGEGVAGIVDYDDMLTPDEFTTRLGIAPEALEALRRAGQVLCVDGHSRGDRYPAWQLGDDGRPVPGLAEVIAAFPGNGWAAFRFLAQPFGQLGGKTPLDRLRRGEAKLIAAMADSAARGDFF